MTFIPVFSTPAATTNFGVTPFNIGMTSITAEGDNGNANLVCAQQAILTDAAIIRGLSFYVTSATGQLRLGIYDSTGSGGEPGALKAQTNAFTPIVGWNSALVVAPVMLPAGTYWIAYHPSSSALAFRCNRSIGSHRFYNRGSFGALPAVYQASHSSGPGLWSLYATFEGSAAMSQRLMLAALAAQTPPPTNGWAALDGRLNAPTGTPQYPTLLNGMAARPPWQVAGVDYRVGVNTGVTLKNPRTDTLPSGVTRNTGTNTFTVTGSNVTLDAWDFTEGGGWHITGQGANTIVSNCNMSNGGDSCIFSQGVSSNLTLRYCVFDGQGTSDAILTFVGSVGLTIEYCWVKNTTGDTLQYQPVTDAGESTLTIRFSLFEDAGKGVGSHGDFLQHFSGEVVNGDISYSLTYMPAGATGFTQGFMFEPDGGPWGAGIVGTVEVDHNVFLNNETDAQYFATGCTVADIVTQFNVHDNYWAGLAMAPGGVRSGPGDASAKTIFTGNVNMDTGLPDDND